MAVLTHGNNAKLLKHTIRSFDEQVSPPPAARFVYQDGPCALPPLAPYAWNALTGRRPQGFCMATRRLWTWMSEETEEEFEYVFWLEHDYKFLRSVDVKRMAAILDEDDSLAQVALMRGAGNDGEREAGGLYEQMLERGYRIEERHDYFRHRGFFTTNPSLMSRQFMSENPWPDYSSECEGKFGINLKEDGFWFAFMGAGEPWVDHRGSRTGFGY